jgi:hypothetical protein
MTTLPFLPLLVALTVAPPTVSVDLSKIDRSIAKEPVYQTRLPKYCLLVFGPEAKARVWLVLDGNDLYIDRNGNGDLTEPGKRIRGSVNGKWLDFAVGVIQGVDGRSRAIDLRVRDFNSANGKCTGLMIVLDGKRKQFVGFDESDPFQFSQRPQQSPVVHVEGPLAMRVDGEPPTFVAGQDTELNIAIGTPGVGKGSFCAIQCCTVLDCKTSPVAEIAFPGREPQHAPPRLRVAIADD